MKLAQRVLKVTPSKTLAITAKAKELKSQGIDVVGLGAGEPDFNTPQHIIDAAVKAMQEGHTKYTAASGILELKQAVCDKLSRDNGLTYKPSQILITNGAKHALYNLFQALIDPGEEVIIPTPYWVSYPEMVVLAEGVPVHIEGKEENEFKVTPEQIQAAVTSKTRAFILNSPSNPTGSIYSREELEGIAQVCLKNNLLIISDEIYEKLIYDGEHVSIATLSSEVYENTVVINGMSKPYSMTGWRIGYAAGNEALIKAMTNLSSHSTSNPTTFAQYGALAALRGSEEPLQKMKAEFNKRRKAIVDLMNNIDGIYCVPPKGAFYLFANVAEAMKKGGYKDVDQWSEDLLEKEYVALIPGSGFGAPNHIRISYATSLEQLQEGAARIKRFVEGK
ncbi:pyridoxal phosphate-dependent aminotransferase [Aneurinibacillus sp. Ricciae_BoGa-3]|uniref:pyridoxal phosphate-dependent aminotransferase n=1 Tax=Aneurinibacillus sp. Ricciae_BoGa-3 TaxID=3022697 RepID=UPI0023410659|nr:pyridoxal phosphate-dependent aminotransferase [Aneurinibacillus sp. Ricciae_BoGa-3]WCK56126.1 pyridoxal phosphate-dependent aminotransferase [Aneurinibacillus sp. Ricciae_BoGa-3]